MRRTNFTVVVFLALTPLTFSAQTVASSSKTKAQSSQQRKLLVIPFLAELDAKSESTRLNPEHYASDYVTTALRQVGLDRLSTFFPQVVSRLTNAEIETVRGRRALISDADLASVFNQIVDSIHAAPEFRVNAKEVHLDRSLTSLGAPHFVSTTSSGRATGGMRPVEAVVMLYLLVYNSGENQDIRKAAAEGAVDVTSFPPAKGPSPPQLSAASVAPEHFVLPNLLNKFLKDKSTNEVLSAVNRVLANLKI